jgi:hypothetical protein
MFDPTPIEDRFYQQKRRSTSLVYTGYTPYTPSTEQLLSQKQLSKEKVVRNPYPELPLQKGLDISYQSNLEKTQKELQPYGYQLDPSLSSKENKVFYNPYSNKMVMSVAGTNPFSPRDIGTDLYLAFAGSTGLKQTQRYKESQNILKQAREKYPKSKKVLIGHSLGSSVISGIANSNEKVLGFGTGSGLFTPKPAVQENRYRTFWDPLSLTSGAKVIPSYIPEKKGQLRGQQKVDYPSSHSYQNLKSGSYFV